MEAAVAHMTVALEMTRINVTARRNQRKDFCNEFRVVNMEFLLFYGLLRSNFHGDGEHDLGFKLVLRFCWT